MGGLTKSQRLWCETLLAPEERKRRQVFRRPTNADQYLVSRALLRAALSSHADVEPPDWRFTADKHGRPHIIAPPGHAELQFTMAHVDGLVGVAIFRHFRAGLDIEHVDRNIGWPLPIRQVCCASEAAELQAMPLEQQRRRFLDLWTLKEAYSKAIGLGLAANFPSIQFNFVNNEVHLAGDRARSWNFVQKIDTDGYILTLAINGPAEIRISEWSPKEI